MDLILLGVGQDAPRELHALEEQVEDLRGHRHAPEPQVVQQVLEVVREGLQRGHAEQPREPLERVNRPEHVIQQIGIRVAALPSTGTRQISPP